MIARMNDSQFALFVDYENVADLDGLHLSRIIKEASAEGSILMLRAYADWSRFGNHRKRLQTSGFELIDLPSTKGKNRADMKLAVDVMETAFTKTFIDSFIIVSGDSDFIPLVTKLNELNRRSWLYTTKDAKSPLLAQYCYRLGPCVAPAAIALPKSSKPTNPRPAAGGSKLTDDVLERAIWVLRAMEQAYTGPHRLPHFISNLRTLEPRLDLVAITGATTRCSIRFAEQLASRGLVTIEYRKPANMHYLSLRPAYQENLAAATPPAWFENIIQLHCSRLEPRVFKNTVVSAVQSVVAADQHRRIASTADTNVEDVDRRVVQLSLF